MPSRDSQCNSHSGSNSLSSTDKYSSLHQLSNLDTSSGGGYRRFGRHKSGHAESRTRKVRPQARQGKSEQPEPTAVASSPDPERTPLAEELQQEAASLRRRKQPPVEVAVATNSETDDDPVIAEREAKRKEIQSLIMKYAALDDIYGKSTADAIASKYQRKNKSRHDSSSNLNVINNNNNNNNEDEIDQVDEDDFVVVSESAKRLGKKVPIVSSPRAILGA